MPAASRIPLAWKNLTHQPRRLLVAVGGIGFAVVLMCMQMGFRNALFDSTVAIHRQLNADLVITSAASYTLSVREPFSRRRLYQALDIPGVAAAYPIYLESSRAEWRNPKTGELHAIRVIAFDPMQPVLESPRVAEFAAQLDEPFRVLADERSKMEEYGNLTPGTASELSGQSATIVGQFGLGTDFANDGNLLMSADNFARYFAAPRTAEAALADVDIGVLRLAPEADVSEVQAALDAALPDDVQVLTKRQFVNQELRFWRDSTPIGFIFGLGTAMGFVVGVIICYQILYADIDDHLPEFATLKAMGYRGWYFIGVVLKQSLWLSLFGFLPGALVSGLLYALLSRATGLLMDLTPARLAAVLSLTVAMCVASGCLALRRVLAADPAELF